MDAYQVIIHAPQELNHSSNIQTGLFELEQAGKVSTAMKLFHKRRMGRLIVDSQGHINKTKQANPKVSLYTLIDKINNKKIQFACDLYDHAEQFSESALQSCDYYFKRHFISHYINALPKQFRNKIYPFGLAFGVKSEDAQYKYHFFLGLFLGNLRLKPDRLVLRRLKNTYRNQLRHWEFIKMTRSIKQFENHTSQLSDSIMFQTRCFPEKNSDVKAIHEQRYSIITLLKNAFPNNFKGGFIPSDVAERKYRNALSNVPSEPHAYLEAMKQAGIVIYTRGLANSPAWKLPEYLSQGKVIIAEPLTAELPEALVHGEHLLYFNTDDELIHHIKTVLKDTALFHKLSANARRYFEDYVHPAKNIKRILDFMIINA